MNIKRSTLFLSVLLLVLSAPVVAGGANEAGKQSLSVDLAGVNLNTEEGQRLAYLKLRHAARQVCEFSEFTRLGSVQRLDETHACYHDTLQRAVNAVNNDDVSQIHEMLSE